MIGQEAGLSESASSRPPNRDYAVKLTQHEYRFNAKKMVQCLSVRNGLGKLPAVDKCIFRGALVVGFAAARLAKSRLFVKSAG